MRLRITNCLLAAGLLTAAGCRSLPATPAERPDREASQPATPEALPDLQSEWSQSEKVLQETRADQAQSERELYELQQTIYQSALALKRMKDKADSWDRALVTNRAALLMMEDRLNDLRRRAELLAATGATGPTEPAAMASAPTAPTSTGPADEAVSTTGSVYKLVADGNAAMRMGDLRRAQELFNQATERDPTLISAHLGLAFCAYQLDELPEARRLVQTVLELDKSQAQAIGLRGLLNWKDGKMASALKDSARAVDLEPNDAQLRKFHGIVLQAGQRTEEAIAEMRRSAELNPTDGETMLNLAILLTRSEPPQLETARSFYEAALATGQPREAALDSALYPAKEKP